MAEEFITYEEINKEITKIIRERGRTTIKDITQETEIPEKYVEEAVTNLITKGTIDAIPTTDNTQIVTIEKLKKEIIENIKSKPKIKIEELSKTLNINAATITRIIKILLTEGEIKGTLEEEKGEFISPEAIKPIAAVSKTIENAMSKVGYEIQEIIGEGGFSVVYKALWKGKVVAVKLPKVLGIETVGKDLLERFIHEARTWSKLKHPHIVEVYDYGATPISYIVMEYMSGGSLRDRLKYGPLPVGKALKIALALLDALDHAHHYGVVHRDLKPENVLFTEDNTPKITDWGLAKVLLEASTRSGGEFRGTLLYAAPEQLDPKTFGEPDWRTDIYQMGLLLYEMLTGELPFKSEEPVSLMFKIINQTPEPPSHKNPQIPSQLDEIILKTLEKKKEDRPRSADRVRIALERLT
ncbi:MAG: hypothetical protein DRJ45_04910 [Thermoprotei archaeon]|nr:MAG: hypothetical protein DRJ45_04910 [Thermoprotei archaeon]